MINRLFIFLIPTLFLITSCQSNKSPDDSIHGIWKSIGFGKILKIEVDNYVFYDVTKISCFPAQEGKIVAFGNAIQLKNDTLSITSGTSIYKYYRINSLPNLCSQNIVESRKNEPIYNFEVMAKTIEENYAYFKLNKIDWDSLHIAFKDRITTRTTDVELFLVLEEMITALNDNHGYIEPTDEIYEQSEKLKSGVLEIKETEKLKEYGDFTIAEMVAKSFLYDDMTKDSWLVHWGKMKSNVGYIQVKAMWLFANLTLPDSLVKENGFVDTYVKSYNSLTETEYIVAEVKGISLIMDKVMEDLKDTDQIIIDVRFNGGGQDAVGIEILRRFNDRKKQVATKRAKSKNGYTMKTPIYIEHSEKSYNKPVFLLTSQQSASATDFMALASLEFDNIKRIGSHTNGAISDALEKELPNGWHFSISNLVYEDGQGKCYENIGVPIDYDLNYPEDRQTFFRSVANDLEKDKQDILSAIENLRIN